MYYSIKGNTVEDYLQSADFEMPKIWAHDFFLRNPDFTIIYLAKTA